MPFEALDAETYEFVAINAFYPTPKSALAGRTFICPVCRRELVIREAFIRNGYTVRPHFVHRLGAPDHPWPYAESPAHLAAKTALTDWLRRDLFWRDAAFLHTETPIRTHRRTDVMVTLPDGSRIAHEIQLSPITRKAFLRRTHDYLTAGIPVFWWFDAARIKRAFRHTPVYLLQPTQLALQFSYPDSAPAAHHHIPPETVFFAIILDDTRRWPDTFRLSPHHPLPPDAAKLLWRAMLWAPLSSLLQSDRPQSPHALFNALSAFWRARFTADDVTRFLEHCRKLGLAHATRNGWLRVPLDQPKFLHPLFTFAEVLSSKNETSPVISNDALPVSPCRYPPQQSPRPLWEMARIVLAAAGTWLSTAEILSRFSAADRMHAETIARTAGNPLLERLQLALTVRWEMGDVVAGPHGSWRLQYLPDFDAADWQAKLAAHFSPDGDDPDPWHAFSVRYHRWFWRRRGADLTDIRRMEFLPAVLTDPAL